MKELSGDMIRSVAERLRALADENRIRLLMQLRDAGEMKVGDLAEACGLLQPSASKHLQILRQVGLVAVRRKGAQSLYHVADQSVFELCDLVCAGVRRHAADRSRALGIS